MYLRIRPLYELPHFSGVEAIQTDKAVGKDKQHEFAGDITIRVHQRHSLWCVGSVAQHIYLLSFWLELSVSLILKQS